MIKTTIAGLVGLLFTSGVFAADVDATSDNVIVTASRFAQVDTEATFASEVYTRKMIEASGATTLFDYLAQQTSLNVTSYFGNTATPQIDMRGYGTASGYQNIVLSVDGQRLNNIDGMPQLLGAIPLGNIDRIEITRGSGSVLFGDGATAGSIQIYTKPKTGVSVSASAGNYGAISSFLSAGISQEYFDLSASAALDRNDGQSKRDSTGNTNSTLSNTQRAELKLKPLDSLRISLQASNSDIDTRYAGSLSLAQLKADPSQNNGSPYTQQKLSSQQWRIGVEYDITQQLKIIANHNQEDKVSDFITSSPKNYDYTSNDIALQFQNDVFSATAGIQKFDGVRSDNGSSSTPANQTTKDNLGQFIQSEYRFAALTVSAGARHEKVKYSYSPSGGSDLNDSKDLNAWDLGLNYQFNKQTSVFANYNRAFQAADIDRLFKCSAFFPACAPIVFNNFVNPEISRTFNLGLNHVVDNNRFKLTLFRANLHDEIYLNRFFENTNIDKSHKYGLEASDQWRISEKLSGLLSYTFTKAIIDEEIDNGISYAGKNVPGVPKQGITGTLNFTPWSNTNLNVSHTWRSSTYAANDLNNDFVQRQNSYQSTNMAASYQYKNLQWFASVSNLFEHTNSLQISDDFIYPVDFSRTWRVGMKADF